MFPKIIIEKMKATLVDRFISGPNKIKSGGCSLDNILVKSLQNYPNINRLVFGSKSKYKPEPKTIKKLILMLIAADCITLDDKNKDRPIVTAVLSVDENSFLNLYNDVVGSILQINNLHPFKSILSNKLT